MVSKNSPDSIALSTKLNRLEDQVAKLTAQIKSNKQSISELKLAIIQRDTQIHELELKLGYAQQSLLEKAINKIDECRIQIKTGIDENVIHPTINQIQQHIKTAQLLVDEVKEILSEKRAFVDSRIVIARNKLVECPGQTRLYVEKSLVEPAQALLNKTLETIRNQANSTRNLVENKAIYPGKVLYDEILIKIQSLPDKLVVLLQEQVLKPLKHTNNQASNIAKNIYPETTAFLIKKINRIDDIVKQALLEISEQIKKSPFWDGKNKVKVSF